MTKDLYVFGHGVRVRAWNRATGETQVGAVPSSETGSIKDEAAGSQFKFGTSQDGARQAFGGRQLLASCDSPYLSSASPGSSSDTASPFLREQAVFECRGVQVQTGDRLSFFNGDDFKFECRCCG